MAISSIPVSERDLCFVDLETTGSLFGFHEVIEGGLIRTSPDGRQVKSRMTVRLLPLHPERATAEAIGVNGFNPNTWQPSHPSSRAALEAFAAMMDGAIPVAHNAGFDRAFLEIALRENGVQSRLPHHWVGTESLAWAFVQLGQLRSSKLSDICEQFGVEPEPLPHTAANGVELSQRVYVTLISRLKELAHEPSAVVGIDAAVVRPRLRA